MKEIQPMCRVRHTRNHENYCNGAKLLHSPVHCSILNRYLSSDIILKSNRRLFVNTRQYRTIKSMY